MDAAVNEGVIKPALKRAELIEWRENWKASSVASSTSVASTESSPSSAELAVNDTVFFAELRVEKHLTDRALYDLTQILGILESDYGVSIRSAVDAYDKRFDAVFHKRNREIEKELVRIVKSVVRDNLKIKFKSISSLYWKKPFAVKLKQAGFIEEDVTIDPMEDVMSECERVLRTFGIEDGLQSHKEKAEANVDAKIDIKFPELPFNLVSESGWNRDYEIKIAKEAIKRFGLPLGSKRKFAKLKV